MIELKQVTKQYGQATVLKNITLSIEDPGIYCLLGRNGAGKTTLLKSIAGYQNLTSGAILVDGKPVTTAALGTGVSYIENFAKHFNLPGTFAPIASFKLLRGAVDAAEKLGVKYMVGNVLSSDVFYNETFDSFIQWKKMGVLCAEMESAALYMNAAQAGKNALCVLTVSDCPMKGTATTAEERQTAFTNMMKVALSLA